MRRSPRPTEGSKKSMKKSDIMAEEAARMEARLQVLRAQMDSDKAKTAVPKSGSSRWRSSRLDRGGISKYADDVKDRAGKPRTRRPKESGSSASAAPRSARRPSTGGRNRLKMDQADKWNVADVSRWLQMIGLDKYKDVFAENEISGEVLLQLQRDDLDYMKVTVLGHRKMLLKGVEQLNVATNGVQPPPVPPPAAKTSAGVGTSDGNEENVTPGSADAKKIHWSHVEPISERKVSGGPVPVNLADGEYDEAKAHEDFTAAVMAWRRGDVAKDTAPAEPGMWKNPLAPPEDPEPATTTSTSTTGADAETGPATGGALLEGDVDEEDEHRKFRAAVAAWREEATGSTEKASCFQCYKLFFKDAGGEGFIEGEKDFCTAGCRQVYVDGVAAAKTRAEARIAERKRAAEDAARMAEEASAKRAGEFNEDAESADDREGSDEVSGLEASDGSKRDAPTDCTEKTDGAGEPPLSARMDEIWAMPVNF